MKLCCFGLVNTGSDMQAIGVSDRVFWTWWHTIRLIAAQKHRVDCEYGNRQVSIVISTRTIVDMVGFRTQWTRDSFLRMKASDQGICVHAELVEILDALRGKSYVGLSEVAPGGFSPPP